MGIALIIWIHGWASRPFG